MAIFGKEGTYDFSLVAIKSKWQKVWKLMQRYHLESKVLAPSKYES